MVCSDPNPRSASTRFTRANVAYYGRRGAAERERRFLLRCRRPEDEKRYQKARLRAAKGLLTAVMGPPTRSRGDPFDPALSETFAALEELANSPYSDIRISAAVAIVERFLPTSPE